MALPDVRSPQPAAPHGMPPLPPRTAPRIGERGMNGRRFNRAEAERRLGPAAVAAARRVVDAAPPLSVEQRAQLRAVFESACPRKATALQAASKKAA